jgi:murein L,D-transpeptidase YcbB/YkuD
MRRSALLLSLEQLLALMLACINLALCTNACSQATSSTQSGIEASIREIVAAASLADLRWTDFSDYKSIVDEFYKRSGYQPAWIHGSELSAQALWMIEMFKHAREKGLEPEDYDASRWDARLPKLRGATTYIARLDVALTVCTMRFVSDLRIGRVNPRHFKFGLSVEQKKYDLAQFLRDRLLPSSDPSALVETIEPPFQGYRHTRAALARYVDLAAKDDGEKLIIPPKPVDPGQTYASIPRLTRFLLLLGDLSPAPAATGDDRLYDSALAGAVMRFQKRHGLNDDGRLGTETLKQLNVPLSVRIQQLQLALERWRWLPSEFSAPPIVVNIPDFRLRALDESNKVALEMRVVVGKSLRTQTPVFSRDMTYVVLRPYWNVPPSILRGEIVRAIERDRNYIANKRYEVTTGNGEVVTSGAISDDVLAQLKAGRLSVRQKPGPTNALGLVKLMFPNEFNVYLHSTPAPELFSRTRRDFSHGCIRVEKPAELAAWVLRNNVGWPVERIENSMSTGADNVTVTLNQRVPVFIVYATALAYENDEVHFYDDIYGHDRKLAAALAKGYPYP